VCHICFQSVCGIVSVIHVILCWISSVFFLSNLRTAVLVIDRLTRFTMRTNMSVHRLPFVVVPNATSMLMQNSGYLLLRSDLHLHIIRSIPYVIFIDWLLLTKIMFRRFKQKVRHKFPMLIVLVVDVYLNYGWNCSENVWNEQFLTNIDIRLQQLWRVSKERHEVKHWNVYRPSLHCWCKTIAIASLTFSLKILCDKNAILVVSSQIQTKNHETHSLKSIFFSCDHVVGCLKYIGIFGRDL